MLVERQTGMKRLRTSLDAALVAVVVLVVAAAGASSGASRAGVATFAAWTGSHSPRALSPFTLAYTSYRGGLSAIYTMKADGTGKQQLTTAQPAFQGQPAYSPDGGRIAYVCGNFELCVMNADGSGQGRLTTGRWPETWEYVDHPTWSPDGREIAFASNAEGKFHVYVINADGTGLHRLPGTSRNDDDPAWSPDGTTIAFDRYRSWSGGSSAIYLMNPDGTQPRRLPPNQRSTAWIRLPPGMATDSDRRPRNDAYRAAFNADRRRAPREQLFPVGSSGVHRHLSCARPHPSRPARIAQDPC